MAKREPPYDPSPEEIAAAARAIRAGWDEDTWLIRGSGIKKSDRDEMFWQPPTIHLPSSAPKKLPR